MEQTRARKTSRRKDYFQNKQTIDDSKGDFARLKLQLLSIECQKFGLALSAPVSFLVIVKVFFCFLKTNTVTTITLLAQLKRFSEVFLVERL